MNSLTIEMALPPKELSPNARCHWTAKAKATKTYRSTAMAATMRGLGMCRKPQWEQATEQATFYFADKRRRDRDNLLASLKAAFDGIADAGLVADDAGITHLPVKIEIDKANPRVGIALSRLETK